MRPDARDRLAAPPGDPSSSLPPERVLHEQQRNTMALRRDLQQYNPPLHRLPMAQGFPIRPIPSHPSRPPAHSGPPPPSNHQFGPDMAQYQELQAAIRANPGLLQQYGKVLPPPSSQGGQGGGRGPGQQGAQVYPVQEEIDANAKCEACGKEANFMCSACKGSHYCSIECQVGIYYLA